MAQDSNQNARQAEAAGGPAEAAEQATASVGEEDAPAADAKDDQQPEAPEQQIERLRGELAAAEDRALRAAAEVENTRRRAERSIENAHKFALERFVGDLLPAVDSFERAADVAGGVDDRTAGSDEAGAGAVAAMAEGVALSLKLLLGAMEKQGIAVVDPIGAPFDPKLHEAMSMVEKADAEPGTVVEVFQKGYTVNGRLARPARVIVAKAPTPATDAEAAGEAEAASAESPAQADGAGDAQDGA